MTPKAPNLTLKLAIWSFTAISFSISTLSEVFLQNHASPSRQRTTRKPKSVMDWLIPQAQLSAKPWYYESARPSVK
jgi:hypothetical protein